MAGSDRSLAIFPTACGSREDSNVENTASLLWARPPQYSVQVVGTRLLC